MNLICHLLSPVVTPSVTVAELIKVTAQTSLSPKYLCNLSRRGLRQNCVTCRHPSSIDGDGRSSKGGESPLSSSDQFSASSQSQDLLPMGSHWPTSGKATLTDGKLHQATDKQSASVTKEIHNLSTGFGDRIHAISFAVGKSAQIRSLTFQPAMKFLAPDKWVACTTQGAAPRLHYLTEVTQ